ncbi:MAG: hypothetical protein JW895_07500 [Thermoleophilaceae bacterium]|nr:hypothetical protein [Thermoleophilaceae bacterium]
MAARLRCWNCDRDLPSPAFSRWQAKQPVRDEAQLIVCRSCGWRYRLAWTAAGWQVTEALRPGQNVSSRP